MRITRLNYESWFLDFLEGNLDPSLTKELQTFIKQNPDLAKELEMWDLIALQASKSIQFEVKDDLKKQLIDQDADFNEFAVAYYEGDLSVTQRLNFESGLSANPRRAAEAEKFGKLKLTADKTIVYLQKEQLKRGALKPIWIKIAAVAAMLLTFYLLYQPGAGIRTESAQLADDLNNPSRKNIIVPEVKLNAEEKEEAKTSPIVAPVKIPAKVPVSPGQHPIRQKPKSKEIPSPDVRVPDQQPSPLKPRGIIIFGLPANIELAVMTFKDPYKTSTEQELSELLKVQIAEMRKSDDRDFLSTEHLGLSGLQFFAKLSGKRLTARKGADGNVHSVSYNSRLLAFSIPVNR